MGSSQSQQKIAAFQRDYSKQPRINHPYFGNHSLLINRNEQKLVICKQMHFQSSAEFKHFMSEFDKIERKPFNIIYPSMVIKNDGLETCSNRYEVTVYYDLVGKNLAQVIKSQGVFSESKAWFLLNEVSKALEILAESYRPHWAICPENIYQNEYQNSFIFDSFFVMSVDPQSFLMKKLENNEFMSEKMQLLLEKGLSVSPTEGFEEDCYCLGFVILFVLTGIHPKALPKDFLQRSQAVKAILHERMTILSSEIIEVIFQLVEKETLRRMDNYQLRRLLKDKEADIIRNQEFDYEKSRKIEGETQRQKPQQIQQKLNLSKYNNSTSIPASYSHQDFNQSQHEGYGVISNRNLEPRMMTQPNSHFMPRLNQTHMVNQNPIASNRNIMFENQPIHHPISFQMLPSNRSNTLTRINSYDRLIPKQ